MEKEPVPIASQYISAIYFAANKELQLVPMGWNKEKIVKMINPLSIFNAIFLVRGALWNKVAMQCNDIFLNMDTNAICWLANNSEKDACFHHFVTIVLTSVRQKNDFEFSNKIKQI